MRLLDTPSCFAMYFDGRPTFFLFIIRSNLSLSNFIYSLESESFMLVGNFLRITQRCVWRVFSRKKFLFLREKEDMVKIKNKKKVLWAFRQFRDKKSKQKWLAQYLKITPQWFRVIYKAWADSGEVFGSCRNLGRPKKETPSEHKELILKEYSYVKNALYLEKSIYAKHKIRIGHNRIHMVLKENDLAKTEPNKSHRRKAWVRLSESIAFLPDILTGIKKEVLRYSFVRFLMTLQGGFLQRVSSTKQRLKIVFCWSMK